jgi:hypothetical protein
MPVLFVEIQKKYAGAVGVGYLCVQIANLWLQLAFLKEFTYNI